MAILAVWTWALPALAAVPGTIAVEGALATVGGGPVADGQYPMTFLLYAAEQGGPALWSEPAMVQIKGGRFARVIGQSKPIGPALAQGGVWLAGQVGTEAELPRKALAAVPFALRAGVAEAVECSGCIPASAIKPGSLDASALSFNYAGSDAKGGAATSAVVAKDLQCTGCVSVAELAFDADVNVGAHSVSATEFIGSGAKLTGLSKVAASGVYADLLNPPDLSVFAVFSKLAAVASSGKYADLAGAPDLTAYVKAASLAKVAGTGAYADLSGAPPQVQGACQVGQVVTGVGADGKLICVAVDAKLKPDGLAEVSNGTLTTVFKAAFAGLAAGPLPIKDYYPKGVTDSLTVPGLGIAQMISVSVTLSNSSLTAVAVLLTDPTGAEFVLFDKNASGTKLEAVFPGPTPLVKGDLAVWNGKNPAGIWTLKVVDSAFDDVPTDGAVTAWQVSAQILSAKKVIVNAELSLGGHPVTGLPEPEQPSDAATKNYVDTRPKGCTGFWVDLPNGQPAKTGNGICAAKGMYCVTAQYKYADQAPTLSTCENAHQYPGYWYSSMYARCCN